MKHIGIDWGTVRTGIAVSDDEGRVAVPLSVVEARTPSARLEGVARVVRDSGARVVVLGRPVSLSGRPGRSVQQVEQFAADLGGVLGMEVVLFDERMTTSMAWGALRGAGVRERRGRRVVDKLAAALILQAYLDHTNGSRLKETEPGFDRYGRTR